MGSGLISNLYNIDGTSFLYLEIIVKPHDVFERDGNDIHVNYSLDVIDAILGTTISVPTVSGDCNVDVPSGTQPNAILRLKGKGVKDVKSDKYGDEFIHINLVTPTKINKEQKDLLTKFKSLESSDNFFDKFKKAFKK